MTTNNQVNESFVISQVETLADEAYKGCGQFYELFSNRYTDLIDQLVSNLSEELKLKVIQLAVPHGYIESQNKSDFNNQVCRHGMHPDFCSHGCGEY
jgi:hypothetical protein